MEAVSKAVRLRPLEPLNPRAGYALGGHVGPTPAPSVALHEKGKACPAIDQAVVAWLLQGAAAWAYSRGSALPTSCVRWLVGLAPVVWGP